MSTTNSITQTTKGQEIISRKIACMVSLPSSLNVQIEMHVVYPGSKDWLIKPPKGLLDCACEAVVVPVLPCSIARQQPGPLGFPLDVLTPCTYAYLNIYIHFEHDILTISFFILFFLFVLCLIFNIRSSSRSWATRLRKPWPPMMFNSTCRIAIIKSTHHSLAFSQAKSATRSLRTRLYNMKMTPRLILRTHIGIVRVSRGLRRAAVLSSEHAS